MVQIREKTASTREFLTIAQRAKAITDKVRGSFRPNHSQFADPSCSIAYLCSSMIAWTLLLLSDAVFTSVR